MRKILFFILVGIGNFSLAQEQADEVLKWISLAEAKAAFSKEQKPILINFFEAGNDSCQLMLDSVYQDKVVKTYLNQSFYCVNIDVSTTDTLSFFDGKTYMPKPKGRHELADMLIPNVELPAVLFFSKEAQGTAYNRYISKHQMLGHLLYYAENAYKTTEWEDFYERYSETFPEDKGRGFTVVKTAVDWLTMEEALKKQSENPKKIYLDIYANWKNICTMMLVSTYADDRVAKILNEEFYPVRFEATTRDSMRLKGTTFKNQAKDKTEKRVHDFAQVLLLSNKVPVQFPSIIIFDEKKGMPMRFHQNYYSPASLEPLLKYYATDAFKTQKFEAFRDEYNQKYKRPAVQK